jgi:rubredoxin
MRCAFCGNEFDEKEAKQGCGACPGGCHSVHCPKCNYSNPLEPRLIRKIRSMFSTNDEHGGDGG